jgi:hypothetical protein
VTGKPAGGDPSPEVGRELALTDQDLERESKLVALEKGYAELERQRHDLDIARDNRRLRRRVAVGALSVMLLQIVAANAIFVWYGDTQGWDVPAAAISAWLGATVVQIVAVVLVITNYLFPRPARPE